MENCNCNNEQASDGAGQLDRYLKALDPSYVKVDGRSFNDMLVFARGYAEQIRFYDLPGSYATAPPAAEVANWKSFFAGDMCVIAGSLATVDINSIRQSYINNRDALTLTPSVTLYGSMFQSIRQLVLLIDNWYALAIPENPLQADLALAINSNLSAQLQLAMAYCTGFTNKYPTATPNITIDYSTAINLANWGITSAVQPDSSIYTAAGINDNIIAGMPYIDDIFNSFLAFVQRLVNDAPQYMNFAMEKYPSHQPYMALFIAFLKLFELARLEMNDLSRRMLDFYYRDVLQLKAKPAQPDRAFIIFQLAKNASQYDLVKGTALTAGKDAAGVDQVYKTEEDFVVNQAQVVSLQTLFIDKEIIPPVSPATNSTETIAFISGCAFANSQDGNGKAFTTTTPRWPAFGTIATPQAPQNICEKLDAAQNLMNQQNNTQIGFSIASPQLVLQGGNRLIKLQFAGEIQLMTLLFPSASNIGGNTSTSQNADMQIWLTGDKGWFQVTNTLLNADRNAANIPVLIEGAIGGVFPKGTPDGTPDYSCYFLDASKTALYIFLPLAGQGVIAFNAKTHTGYTYNTAYPVMQFLAGPQLQLDSSQFNSSLFSDFSLLVQVGSINKNAVQAEALGPQLDGLQTLVVQTASGLVQQGKPFDPFTVFPAVGNSFYIGSAEIFNKPFTSTDALTVNIINTKAANDSGDDGNGYLASLLQKRKWDTLLPVSGPEFTTLQLSCNMLQTNPPPDQPPRSTQPEIFCRAPIIDVIAWAPGLEKGFLRIDLAQTGARFDPNNPMSLGQTLNIKSLSISYQSTLAALDPDIDQVFHVYPFGNTEVYIGTETTSEKLLADADVLLGNEQVLLRLPGKLDFQKLNALRQGLLVDAKGKLFPQFTYPAAASLSKLPKAPPGSTSTAMENLLFTASGITAQVTSADNQYSGTEQEEGMLFVGVQNLQPLQSLSLLFQFAEGSALDTDDAPPTINWSYLVNNNWMQLGTENVVSDSTYGFQTTGIVRINVPQDANDHHSILADKLYWFCASVTSGSKCIPQLVAVMAQATEVQFADRQNAPAHYANAMPAGSIAKLSVPVAQIASVKQPFASFDGIPAEKGKKYYTRVSERLRHKNRAITPWDYERLVLENFPGVFAVKCITNTNPATNCMCPPAVSVPVLGQDGKPVNPSETVCCGPVVAPGNVLVITIPNLKNNNSDNPLQPQTSRRTLIEIEQLLQPLTSPFVTVYAKNPVYERVIVYFKVKFGADYDIGYHITLLNQEIVQFLTPWAFNAAVEANFSREIYASSVIAFIEQREYVDFITDFLMYVCRDTCCPPDKTNAPALNASGDFIASLGQVTDCDDIETFLVNQTYFDGDVIAKPSTPRSILVSAAKHIIIPYQDPAAATPCEQRAAVKKEKMKPAT